MSALMRLLGCVCAASSLAAGCARPMSGHYGNEKDGAEFEFKSQNRVEVTVLGSTRVGTYRIEDGKVYVTTGNDTQAFRFDANGCIDGGFAFGTLCRQ
jgi:hypothetical protein